MAGSNGRAPSEQAASATHRHAHLSNGAQRERVTDIQRARMLAAMAEAACEHGAANVTVAHVVACAGVSRRTFYEIFNDVEDCFLAAFDHALEQASRRVRDAHDPKASWAQRIRASLVALLSYLDEDPFMGRLLIVESLGAGPGALRRRQDALARVIAAVDEGRGEGRIASEPPSLAAEGTVGGVLSILHARFAQQPWDSRAAQDSHAAQEPQVVQEPRGAGAKRASGVGGQPSSGPAEQAGGDAFVELASPLMSMIVLPYLGRAAARRELNRTTPVPPIPRRPSAGQDRLHRLGMRLTYRTIRVLGALAAHPGSSNRQVAREAGIADQGQMSKLLSRLQQIGLIENANAPAPTRGEPNAWTLTSEGWQVQSALAQQLSG